MRCPSCLSKSLTKVYKNEKMPYGISMPNETINLKVSFCQKCNFTFQSSAYTKKYDEKINKLYSSYNISDMYNFPNKNDVHLKALNFISKYIKNDIKYNILEIGSNRGDFLYMIKEKFPHANILGCEPTEFKKLKVPTINSFYDRKLFNNKFDLIILRHTLEHIKNPKQFVKSLEDVLKKDAFIFVEVPNLYYSLKNYIEDFTPDHVNYFSLKTLTDTFNEMNIVKYEDKKFLYTIFSKKRTKKVIEVIEVDTKKLFIEFNHKLQNSLKELIKHNTIIFYGVGNFYLWIYTKLQKDIKDKKLYFMDDYTEDDDLFGLTKTKKVTKNAVVVLCSSSIDIQDKMVKKLKKGTKVMRPYKGIEIV